MLITIIRLQVSTSCIEEYIFKNPQLFFLFQLTENS
jgi:hypothetical protein